jgi:hypothetical protein
MPMTHRTAKLRRYHHNVPRIPKLITGLTPLCISTTNRIENGKVDNDHVLKVVARPHLQTSSEVKERQQINQIRSPGQAVVRFCHCRPSIRRRRAASRLSNRQHSVGLEAIAVLVTVSIRPYHNFVSFVRQTGETKAQTCAKAIFQQLTLTLIIITM